MKKLLLATIAVGLMSISANAAQGTITEVQKYVAGYTIVKFQPLTGNAVTWRVIGTDEAKKVVTAMAMTAQQSAQPVEYEVGQIGGVYGITKLVIK